LDRIRLTGSPRNFPSAAGPDRSRTRHRVFRGLRPRPGGAARRAPSGPLLAALWPGGTGSSNDGMPGDLPMPGASGGSCIGQDEEGPRTVAHQPGRWHDVNRAASSWQIQLRGSRGTRRGQSPPRRDGQPHPERRGSLVGPHRGTRCHRGRGAGRRPRHAASPPQRRAAKNALRSAAASASAIPP